MELALSNQLCCDGAEKSGFLLLANIFVGVNQISRLELGSSEAGVGKRAMFPGGSESGSGFSAGDSQ